MRKLVSFFILAFVALGFAKVTVNKSIHIDAGEHVSGGCTTVNGSIVIEKDARIEGGCKTVNGSITVHEGCFVRGIATVNGGIRVGEDAEIEDDIVSVNGSIACAVGVSVDGDVKSVNGAIRLQGVTVQGDITTYNGGITLEKQCTVYDDIIIKDARHGEHHRKPLEIVIDNSVVKGDVINKDDDKKVIVYLRNGGRVKGEIRNARVERD